MDVYNKSSDFNTSSGGKMDNVYLIFNGRKFPKDEEGLSGVFYKNGVFNTPWFVSTQGVSYNLNTYVALDNYDQYIIF